MAILDLLKMPKEKTLQQLARRFPQVDITALQSYLLFLKVSSDLEQARREQLARHGLSPGRFVLLMLLFDAGKKGLSPTHLAKSATVSGATVTGLIDGLQKSGLVQRKTSPKDRRVQVIVLTPKAERLLDRMLPHHFYRVARLMSGISSSDRKTLYSCLEKMQSGIRRLRSEHGA